MFARRRFEEMESLFCFRPSDEINFTLSVRNMSHFKRRIH